MNKERYYIQPTKYAPAPFRVIDKEKEIPVFNPLEDRKTEIFRTYEDAQECCETLNDFETK